MVTSYNLFCLWSFTGNTVIISINFHQHELIPYDLCVVMTIMKNRGNCLIFLLYLYILEWQDNSTPQYTEE